jgi:hypothetical protein
MVFTAHISAGRPLTRQGSTSIAPVAPGNGGSKFTDARIKQRFLKFQELFFVSGLLLWN